MKASAGSLLGSHVRPCTTIVEIRAWTEDEFGASEAQWQDLLGRSGADPLFMSWSWQWSWWRHHAALLQSSLYLLAAYSAQGELVGLAPLHLRRVTHRVPISAGRLETIGSTWRQPVGVYSEYLDFIVDTRYEEEFQRALAGALLRDRSWCDLIVANCKKHSVAARLVGNYLGGACYMREADPVTSHLTSLPADFGAYVRGLHAGVRRKVWNQRTRLPGAQLAHVGEGQIDGMFDVLNDFHQRRWGVQLFHGRFRAFHRDFATLCAQRDTLRMSALNFDGSPISILYNVRIGAVEYNIQSGFSALTRSGTSPAYLHFGFCMEQASQEGVRHFDFLAGGGRKRDYKRDFNTRRTDLVTFQSIRTPALAWLYRQYDRIRARS